MRNAQSSEMTKAIDALNKIKALSVAAQFLNCTDTEEECRLDLLSIIEDICVRTTAGEIKQ